jgi:ribosomal protein S13
MEEDVMIKLPNKYRTILNKNIKRNVEIQCYNALQHIIDDVLVQIGDNKKQNGTSTN